MTPAIILSSIFVVLSLIISILCFTYLKKKSYSKYVGASALVYASACIFILLLAVFKKDLPILFFILADVLSGGVFAVTTLVMVLLSTKIMSPPGKTEERSEKDG
ncbi:MAG: hypothetical protein J6Y58_01770 [Clostridiales bacterium]|nr:hypothetical protein [Clostridiales bacterium]